MKLATAGALATVPFAGWISALITFGFARIEVCEAYQLWKEFHNIPTDEDTSPTTVEAALTTDIMGSVSSVTPVASSTTGVSTQPGTMGAYKSRAGTRNTSPTGVEPNGGAPAGGGGKPNGQIDPSKTTFADLSPQQQDAFFAEQRKQEGFGPGKLQYDLNNPGNMVFRPWMKKYGGELDTTGRGVGKLKGKFARFPTVEAGVEAQKAVWSSPKFANLPLDKALNLWVTGDPNSEYDEGMKAKNTNYKNAIYASIGAPQATTLTSASTPSITPSTASSGSSLTMAQASISEQRYRFMGSGGGQTIINAPTTNSVTNGGSSGGNNVNPYNGDLMRYLLRPVA